MFRAISAGAYSRATYARDARGTSKNHKTGLNEHYSVERQWLMEIPISEASLQSTRI